MIHLVFCISVRDADSLIQSQAADCNGNFLFLWSQGFCLLVCCVFLLWFCFCLFFQLRDSIWDFEKVVSKVKKTSNRGGSPDYTGQIQQGDWNTDRKPKRLWELKKQSDILSEHIYWNSLWPLVLCSPQWPRACCNAQSPGAAPSTKLDASVMAMSLVNFSS